MNDIIIEITNPPEIVFDINQETNEVIFEVKSEVIEFNVEGVVYGEKGDAGEGIDNFEADLSLLYQIAKL
mgnify:CR=1 FL=1